MNYKEIELRVQERISDYIGFDVNELFLVDHITIYGGAIRDSIANMIIHDIDILCMPHSARKLKDFLIKKGYYQLELYDQDTLNMYKGLTLIGEPWTFVNKNKIIQIIRPRWNIFNNKDESYSVRAYEKVYHTLISNVDISCCGVFLEQDCMSKLRLKEACKNAIAQCLTKTFKINYDALLYNENRIFDRTHKLESRGWINFSLSKDIKIEREIKLTEIELYCDQINWNDTHN